MESSIKQQSKKTILLVDDLEDILDCIQELFKIIDPKLAENFNFYKSTKSEDAIRRLTEGGIVALITDGNLGENELTGLDISEVALEVGVPKNCIAMYTADIKYQKGAEELGIQFFQKPDGLKLIEYICPPLRKLTS